MESGFNLLGQLDFPGFLGLFWFFMLFEFPRYTLSSLAVGIRAAFMPDYSSPPEDMTISVLLAGHNEAATLPAAIHALRDQSHQNLEIIVVDDGSTDDMAKVAQQMREDGLIDHFVSTGIRGGKAGALNLGLEYVSGEILVVLDIDTSLDRDAIALVVGPLLDDPETGAVGGNLAVRNPEHSLLTTFQAIEYYSNISVGRQFTAMFDWLSIVSGAFGAFRVAAIRQAGGWDVGPGDDSNLTTKIRRLGWRIAFEHRAWALTDVPASHAALWRQRLRWNRSLIRNRLRKFVNVFNPLEANFAFRDMAAALNLLWFHLGLSVTFVIYLAFMLYHYPELFLVIFVVTHILTISSDIFELLVAALFTRRPGIVKLFPYAVGYSLYIGYYQRLNRLIAYFSELTFRKSYDDPFYPSKVRDAQDQF